MELLIDFVKFSPSSGSNKRMDAFIWKKYIDNLIPFLRIYLFQWMHVQKEASFVPTWEYLLSHLGSSIIRQCDIIQYSSQRLTNRSIECDVKWRHHFYAHGFVHRCWLSHCMVCVPYVGPHNLIEFHSTMNTKLWVPWILCTSKGV